MTSQFTNMTLFSFFLTLPVTLVKFIYWSKFHVNIMTGSGIMTIFVYKWLTRNAEIRHTPVCILPNIWKLGWVRNTKFGTNVCNKRLLNAAKYQGYSFYCSWVITGKPTRGIKLPLPLPWLWLRVTIFIKSWIGALANIYDWIFYEHICERLITVFAIPLSIDVWQKSKSASDNTEQKSSEMVE